MSRRSLVLGVLAWVVVVISASAVTWAVIDAAGQQVLSASDVPPQAAVPDPSTAPTPPSPSPSRSVTRAPSVRTPSPAPSSDPTRTVPAPAPTPSATRGPASPQSSPTRQTRPPATQQRTWEGPTGSVAVRCTGSTASLQSASPSDGYRVEVGSRGPGEVEVEFRGDERRVKVRAGCVAGTPRFSTENETEHSDD